MLEALAAHLRGKVEAPHRFGGRVVFVVLRPQDARLVAAAAQKHGLDAVE